ncbi:hypothetical protein [Oceanobacillus manasiensis]|uniref:hypothetical protein n=1 Tax=Oceanobacillus manasiensis TaxID=586413 RepID=UPI000694504B|nr:hypothetical protein [Oceanobacillus manasiensis]
MKKLVHTSLVTLVSAILIIIGINIGLDHPLESATAVAKSHHGSNAEQKKKEEPIQPANLKDEKVKELMQKFMDTLVQDTDDTYKVKNMDTKEELRTAFESIAEREVFEPFIDYYFNEKGDGLYILPTETPPWFVAENPYDMVQLENNLVRVKQENENPLQGKYTIEIDFVYDKQWKISNIAIS